MNQPTDEQIVSAICADYDRIDDTDIADAITYDELGALVREIRRLRAREARLLEDIRSACFYLDPGAQTPIEPTEAYMHLEQYGKKGET